MSKQLLLINGSPRKNGNTHAALLIIQEELKQFNINSKIIQVGGINIKGCQACQMCGKLKNKQCSIKDDLTPIMEECFSDNTLGIIIGSPTYFSNVTTETKAFIDRVGYVSKNNGGLLKNKVGASVVIDRRSGSTFVYSAINFFFGINEMPIATSIYWNNAKARKIGDLASDEEGVLTFKTLAKNIAKLIKVYE